MGELAAQQSAELFNSEYLQRHPNKPPVILAAARALHYLKGVDGSDEVRSLVWQLLHPECIADVQTCLAALVFIGEVNGPDTQESFRSLCSERYPLATVFLRNEEQDERRREIDLMIDNAA